MRFMGQGIAWLRWASLCSLVSWCSCFTATGLRPAAERRCFAASIQIVLNVNLIPNHHPKEDLYPPATMQRGQHGSGGAIPGYPMGSGREHRSCDDQAGGTHYQSICSETPASRPVRSPSTCWVHPAGLSFNPHRAGASAPSFGKLSLRGERGFHQPVVSADFPGARTRSAPVLFPATDMPQGKRRDPLCVWQRAVANRLSRA
jgi:hypothetical protein